MNAKDQPALISAPVIGVGVLIWREQQLLLGKRLKQDHNGRQTHCWQFPGGHLEYGESVTGCATREVMEETGLQVTALRHYGYTNEPLYFEARYPERQGQTQHYLTLLVSCDYKSGKPEVIEPDKCECWQWFDYQHLPAPLFEPITEFFKQLEASDSATSSVGDLPDLYLLHKTLTVLPETPAGEHK